MTDKAAYWLELAEYDLETARAMLDTGRYLYVGFMCHQVIEKALKGLYVQVTGETPPYVHDLRLIARRANVYDEMPEHLKDVVDMLIPMNIQSRYPTDWEEVRRGLNKDRCLRILQDTGELHTWIKERLLSE